MIRVTVQLLSANTGLVTEIARMDIVNDGDSQHKHLGNYTGFVKRGRSAASLAKSQPHKIVHVRGHRRLSLHVWHLVAKLLIAADFGK